jgi:hypothetical protein
VSIREKRKKQIKVGFPNQQRKMIAISVCFFCILGRQGLKTNKDEKEDSWQKRIFVHAQNATLARYRIWKKMPVIMVLKMFLNEK